MRHSPVICWLARRVTVDWGAEGGGGGDEGGGQLGSPPFRTKAIVLYYSWRGCWGLERESKSISTPVFHHQGSYQLD